MVRCDCRRAGGHHERTARSRRVRPAVPQRRNPSDDPRLTRRGSSRLGAKVADGDGYVFVIPEYNHGYPAAVKNALDHLFSEWSRKPIGFVSYGGLAGGVRAVEQLRQVAVELDMVPVRCQVAIARIWQAIDEHGKLRPPVPLQEAQPLLDDIGTWATAFRAGRAALATTAAA